jgi:predicted MFS family arabinose efflux permease
VRPLRALGALYRDAFGGLPRLTWLLCVAGFVNRAGAMVVPFLSLYLGSRFGYSVGEAGRLVSVYGLGAVLGSLAGGRLCDLLGPVRVQIATLLAAGVWMWLLTLAESPLWLGIGVFVLGVLNDSFRPGNITAVGASCPPHLRRKALSLNRLALNAGWAVGPTVGGYLANADYRWLFAADGATCVLAAVFLWFVLRGRALDLPPARPADHDPRRDRPFRDPHFVWLFVCTVLYLLMFMQYFSTESRWLEQQFGYDTRTIGWFLAINPIVIVLCEMVVVHALRGHRALPIVALGSLVTGLGYLPLLWPAVGAPGIALSMLVIAVGEILQMPQLGAYVNDHAPPHARGAYNGAYTSSFSVAMVAAPWLGGELYDVAGPAALWWSCAGLGVVSGAGFWWAARRSGH